MGDGLGDGRWAMGRAMGDGSGDGRWAMSNGRWAMGDGSGDGKMFES